MHRNASPVFHVAHPDRFFIGGQWVAASTDDQLDLVEPVTEEVFMSVAAAANEDMDRAVAAVGGRIGRYTLVGREGGREGLKAYVELKTVILDTEPEPARAN